MLSETQSLKETVAKKLINEKRWSNLLVCNRKTRIGIAN